MQFPKSEFRNELVAYLRKVAQEIQKDGYTVKKLGVSPTVFFDYQNLSGRRVWDLYFETEHPRTEWIMGSLLPAHIPHWVQAESWIEWQPYDPKCKYWDGYGNQSTFERPGNVIAWVCEYLGNDAEAN